MRIAIVVGFAALVSASVLAQQVPAREAKPAPIPRTADGKPDLQGIWTNATLTPLERPQNVKALVLTEAEAASMEKASLDRREKLNEPSDPDRPAPPQGGDGSPETAA